MAQLERADLHGEIELRFRDNTTEEITPLAVRDFLHELVDSALLAASDSLELSKWATLQQARSLLALSPPTLQAGQLYAISGAWNAAGNSTVYVPAISNRAFHPQGVLFAAGIYSLVTVDVVAGTAAAVGTYEPIPQDKWGTNDPPQMLATVNEALNYLHGRAATAPVLTTPTKPNWNYLSAGRTLSLAHGTLAPSELEYTHDGGLTWLPYTGTLTIDDAKHDAGDYIGRVKAATGRNVSAIANSPAIAAAVSLAPTIAGFTPTAGPVGTRMVITGTNFTGATLVSVSSGAVGSFTVDSATQITAVLNPAQASGLVKVTTPGGTATSTASFTVTPGMVRHVGLIEGQSNDNGSSPQKDFPAAYRAASALTDIWNDDSGQVEALQMGVNECGLNGNAGYPAPANGYPYTRSDGAVILAGLAGFYDGAGMEVEYSRRHDAAHAVASGGDGARFTLFKYNVNHATSTFNAGLAQWQQFIFAANKEQWQRFVAWCTARGETVVVDWISFGVKEAEFSNANYVADVHGLLNRFETEGITTPTTLRLIPRAPQTNSQSVAGYQDQLVATYPNQYRMYRNANTTYLADGVHFDSASMIVWGDRLFEAANNIQAPPPPPGGPLELGYLQYQHGLLTAAGATTNSTNAFMVGCAVRLDYLDTIEPSAFSCVFFQGINGSGREGLTCNIDKNTISFRYLKADGNFDFLNIARATLVSQGVQVGILASFDGQTLKVAIGSSAIQTRAIGQALKGATQPTAWGALQYKTQGGDTALGYGLEGGLQNLIQFNRAAVSDAELSSIAAAGCQLTAAQRTETACVVYAVDGVNDQAAISFDNLAKPANPVTIMRYA